MTRQHPETTLSSSLSRRRKAAPGALQDADAARVLSIVSGACAVPVGMLLHASRCKSEVAKSRQVAMYLTHVVCGRTLTDVGRLFGRDRTTAAHACRRIEDERDRPGFDRMISVLEEQIGTTASNPPGKGAAHDC